MKKIPKTVWVLLGLLAATYVAWDSVYPHGTWRYKMTVVVETPEGIKTGSAVREISAQVNSHFFGSTSSGSASVKGEAVVVDLGKYGVLFALMRGGVGGVDYGHYVVFDAFPIKCSDCPWSPEGIRYYRSLKNDKATLKPEQYPTFVRFSDLNDPRTVEPISQYNNRDMPDGYGGTAKTADKVFGASIKLKEVTIEMANDPVTTGIEKKLPWLVGLHGGYLSGKNSSRGSPLGLHGGEFQRGLE